MDQSEEGGNAGENARKNEYTCQLLGERMDTWFNWKTSTTTSKSIELKRSLDRNKIALIHNAPEDILDSIFGNTNEQDVTKFEHVLNVVMMIRKYMTNDNDRVIMDDLIATIKPLIKREEMGEIIETSSGQRIIM